ncbi:protein yciF [Klebsiella pneumoniae]|nr:protein yciF [Klebsiella pneumoniae]
MNMKSIEDVFIHLLSDTYSAEKQLTRGLAKLARAASSEKLSAAFNAHLEETQGQIERIDQIIEQESNLKIKRMKCVAMEGLIEEANEVVESTEKNEVRDAALIAAAQRSSITKLPVTVLWSPWQSSWAIKKQPNCLPKPWKKKNKPM